MTADHAAASMEQSAPTWDQSGYDAELAADPKQLRNMHFWDHVDLNCIHDPVHTFRAVPEQAHFAVAELRAELAKGANSFNPQSSPEMNLHARRCMIAFLWFERILMANPPKRRGGRRGQKSESLTALLTRRIRWAWSGSWELLWREADNSIHNATSTSRRPEEDQLRRDIEEIRACALDGDLRGALRSLQGPFVLANPDVVRRTLPIRFPEAHRPVPVLHPGGLPDAADVAKFEEELKKVVGSVAKHRGPGPGGARNEHWEFQCHWPEVWTPVSDLLLKFALGRIPSDLMNVVASGRLIAVAKGDDDIRPLTLGMVPRRLVSRAAARTFQPRVNAVLNPLQYAVGEKGGGEVMHKAMHCALHARPEACLFSYDVENAHSSIERGAVLESVRRRLPALAPWALPWLSATPTHVCHMADAGWDLEVNVSRGLDQGDPLSNLLYPIGAHDLLEDSLHAAKEKDPEAIIAGYSDDIDLITTPEAEAHAKPAMCAAAVRAGLNLKESKGTVYAQAGVTLLPGCSAARIDRPVVLRQAAPVPVLQDPGAVDGSQVRPDSPEIDHLIGQRRAACERLVQLRQAGLSSQLALSMLRVVVNSDCTFLARAIGLPQEVCRTLDDMAVRTIEAILGVSLAEPQSRRRIFHPFRHGGLGFTSLLLSAEAAHVASWHTCLPRLMELTRFGRVEALAGCVPRVAWAFARIPDLLQLGGADPLQSTSAAVLELAIGQGKAPSQKQLTTARVEADVTEMMADAALTDSVRAVILSSGGPGAGAWLLPPSQPQHILVDEHFAIAVKLRMGLPLPTGGGCCRRRGGDGRVCGAPLDSSGKHAISCMCGGLTVQKHNSLSKNLSGHMERSNNVDNVRREQLIPEAAPHLVAPRMDICATDASGSAIHVDLTVASPLCSSALRAGSSYKPGVAADVLARHKITKYRLAKLTPFAIETFGRLSDSASDFVRVLAPADSSRSRTISAMHQDLATILQRFNAEMVLTSAA